MQRQCVKPKKWKKKCIKSVIRGIKVTLFTFWMVAKTWVKKEIKKKKCMWNDLQVENLWLPLWACYCVVSEATAIGRAGE